MQKSPSAVDACASTRFPAECKIQAPGPSMLTVIASAMTHRPGASQTTPPPTGVGLHLALPTSLDAPLAQPLLRPHRQQQLLLPVTSRAVSLRGNRGRYKKQRVCPTHAVDALQTRQLLVLVQDTGVRASRHMQCLCSVCNRSELHTARCTPLVDSSQQRVAQKTPHVSQNHVFELGRAVRGHRAVSSTPCTQEQLLRYPQLDSTRTGTPKTRCHVARVDCLN